VLLAAGPFDVTGPAISAACLDARCSYLDINGEVDDAAKCSLVTNRRAARRR
jgi:short subunit dehydrogenase-like uncharacterized protein